MVDKRSGGVTVFIVDSVLTGVVDSFVGLEVVENIVVARGAVVEVILLVVVIDELLGVVKVVFVVELVVIVIVVVLIEFVDV